jgi:poly(3-hydroxybutyrate) depolymerase
MANQMVAQSVRYKDEIFPGYTLTSNIQYGVTSTQSMDYYVGTGDTVKNRPLIVFIHGGGFKSGDKVSNFGTLECGGYARRGYFVISINYRLSSTTTADKDHFEAMIKALQDAKAAVRYMRKNWSVYGIDTTKIYVTGSSAGSETALHMAYLQDSEVPSYVDMASLGGTLEGSQGNPGYSSGVQGVIENWGALADYKWMANNNIPVYCVHGTSDVTVPCDSSFSDGPFKYGSIIINNYAATLGYQTGIKLFSGSGHTLDNNTTLQTQAYQASAAWLYAVLSNPASPISITSPNGEEIWQTGSSHAITWIASGLSTVDLSYTTDNGSNWISIANSITASSGSYSWTVPNTPSTNCKVRIRSSADSTVSAVSNVVFTISSSLPPSINLLSPVGTESYDGNSTQAITWTSTNVTSLKIDFTSDNGATWSNIASSITASSGTYAWTVPNITSGSCKIRLRSSSDTTVLSTSVDVFSITAVQVVTSLTITSPNGGESWAGGSLHNITWTSSGVGGIKIEFTTNNGTSWNTITSAISASRGSYAWTLPNSTSTLCKVRLTSTTDASVVSASSSTFSILAPGTGQTLCLEENFVSSTTGAIAATNGWSSVTGSNTGTQISYADSNLTFGVYPSSSGKAAYFTAGGTGKIFKNFTYAASSAIYLACLVDIPIASQSQTNHIIGFGSGDMSTTATYELKVYCKWNSTTSSYNFGLGGSSSTYASTPTSVPARSVALIILKYDLGTTADLYVVTNSSSIPYTLPSTSEVHITGLTKYTPSCVYMRSQGGSSGSTLTAIVDGIRVSADAYPLPVELSSFTTQVNECSVVLNWETKTENNSACFIVEREKKGIAAWNEIAALPAKGNSSAPVNYSFTDKELGTGQYIYRLKQVDNDGTYTYSEESEVQILPASEFILQQNYPNPFNPSTVIRYSVPNDEMINLSVYSLTGQKIKTLVNEFQPAGNYAISFNAQSLASGMYFYRLSSSKFTTQKKMILVR